MALPIKGVAYSFNIQLVDRSNPVDFLTSPTIATGDFQVSIDGGTLANLTNLPSNVPAGSAIVRVILTAAEMDGDKVSVIGIDAAGNAWEDVAINLDLPEGTVETVLDILEGDHTETNIRALIKKKGTQTVLIDKKITGSLLSQGITIITEETP